jgi:hypothetical protein
LNRVTLLHIALALPLVGLGLYAGGHIHTGFHERDFVRIVGLLLIARGVRWCCGSDRGCDPHEAAAGGLLGAAWRGASAARMPPVRALRDSRVATRAQAALVSAQSR